MQDEFSEIMSRLSENARFALQKADFFSKKYNQGGVATEHLLLGILSQDTSTAARLLSREGITLDLAEHALGRPASDVAGAEMAMMSLSEACVLILRIAANYSRENGLDIIGTEHLLFAILAQSNSRASILLKDLGADLNALKTEINALTESQAKNARLAKEREKYTQNENKLRFLHKYGTELTELAKSGKLDAVIGRDNEIERTITILGRRTKSNPVLIGEAGVGKTAIVEGLAQRIAKKDVPGFLIGKRLFEIDLSSIVAGTKFRGEFEERIKGVIDEAISDDSVILFIDELHLLIGAGSSEGSMDAANILKPALARGQIQLIGATTLDEYRKSIEKDKALSRRFQTVLVEEPSKTITLRILKGIKSHYEKHHGVKIPDELLKTAIDMSIRYINDRYMPDKVIDIIDEASAICKVSADKKAGGRYKKLKIEASDLTEKISAAAEAEDFERAALLKTELINLEKEIKKLKKAGAKVEKAPILSEDDLRRAVSLKTGIPVNKVSSDELQLLSTLESHLKKSLIGQDEAVAAVARAVRRGRSGITDSRRPIGSFLFMGPTGVGKTELARVLAREVFGSENALIKIDMSEFGEKHNVSQLVGAPAGYVGYDDGGKLTEAVRRHPYSVVLFDEIEKAHPDVFNILLQILEDGVLTDGQGVPTKFNNSIVILTSNLGSRAMTSSADFGFSARGKKDDAALELKYEEDKSAAKKALEKAMRPELINRLDSILVFRPLTRKNVDTIFDNLVEDLRKRLATQSIGLRIDAAAKNFLIEQSFDPETGARPLRHALEDHVESLISDAIISGEIQKGQIASITLTKNQLKLKVEND